MGITTRMKIALNAARNFIDEMLALNTLDNPDLVSNSIVGFADERFSGDNYYTNYQNGDTWELTGKDSAEIEDFTSKKYQLY